MITTEPEYTTIVIGMAKLMPAPDTLPEWNVIMAAALIAMLFPILVVVTLLRL
jgi:sn-glycerol 3-phosphate transport system permease protein